MELIDGIGHELEEIEKELGPARFLAFQKFLADKSVFVCGHRKDAKGNEVHCAYKKDYDQFLAEVR